MSDPHARRRERVAARLGPSSLDGLLVSTPENRRYLTGFTGSWGMVVLSAREAVLLTDGRYVEQAGEQASGCRVVRHGPEPAQALKEVVTGAGLGRLGFEKEHLTVGWREKLGQALADVDLVPTEGLVEAERSVKEPGEVELVRRAAAITDEALREVVPLIRPGAVERDLALEIEFRLKRRGAAAVFEIIVASGSRSSLPHGRASGRVLEAGDLVTIDVGAQLEGYWSDLTRTFVLGHPDPKQEEVYRAVLDAQTAALEGLRPGMTGKEGDALARQVIAARGYGEHFGHGLGHGVGLAVHEGPRVSLTGEARLEEGNVVTVEPGVYLPGWGGVRIEDLVVLRTGGAERLSGFPRELMAL